MKLNGKKMTGRKLLIKCKREKWSQLTEALKYL